MSPLFRRQLVLLVPLVLLPIAAQAQLAAFPGAQGAGAVSWGGRGTAAAPGNTTVYEVTNTNDAGVGSLRNCVNASGPRTCIFRTGGTIVIQSRLYITNPYITIAGQTAPGGGIQIDGRAVPDFGIRIETHDVTIRYLRIRMGFNSTNAGAEVSVLIGNFGNRSNVMLDHLSLEWIDGKHLTIWDNDEVGSTTGVTLQWSLVAEPFTAHPTNAFTGGFNSVAACRITNFDGHHNLLMNTSHRNPLIKDGGPGRWVSNIVYNWSFYAYQQIGGSSWDLINNYFKAGPINGGAQPHEIQLGSASGTDACNGNPSNYLTGNVGPTNSVSSQLAWQVTGENGSEVGQAPGAWIRGSPLAAQTFPITADAAGANLENVLLSTVGASRSLDCHGVFFANRDSIDQRLIAQEQNNGGFVPVNENDTGLGGFITLAAGSACAETVAEGIPDAWKTDNGLTLSSPIANNVGPGSCGTSGYTVIECYMNGTGTNPPPPPTQPVLSISPATMTFTAVVNGANPATQALSIANTGTGTMTWTASANQTWVTLSPASGTTSTAPSTMNVGASIAGLAIGTYTATVTVTATGATGSPATVSLTLNVNSSTLQLTTTSLPQGLVNVAYSAQLTATGGTPPYTWSVLASPPSLALPPGLSLNTSTGAITGTPTTPGNYTPSFTVTDSLANSTGKVLSIVIQATALPVVVSGGAIFKDGVVIATASTK